VRATVDGLATPHPLGHLLPGLYHDDDLAQRFTSALDVVLAPVLATLDSSDAYVDPRLAPLDFVEWLAEWVGVELDASWPEARQRTLVARAADLYSWRGTVRGVTEAVAIYTGVEPEVSETGGTAWTGTPPPAGQLPGSPSGLLLVRVRVAPDEPIDAGRLDRLVAAAKPAHIAHRVEIIEDERMRPRALPPEPPPLPPVPDDIPSDLDAGGWPGDDEDDGITITSARGIPPAIVPGTEPEPGAEPRPDTGTESEAPPVLPASAEPDRPTPRARPDAGRSDDTPPPAPRTPPGPRPSAPPPGPPAPPRRPPAGPPPPPRRSGSGGSSPPRGPAPRRGPADGRGDRPDDGQD
jgi:phage tail-like protein